MLEYKTLMLLPMHLIPLTAVTLFSLIWMWQFAKARQPIGIAVIVILLGYAWFLNK